MTPETASPDDIQATRDQAHTDLQALQSDAPKLQEVVDRQEAALADADDPDQQLDARAKLDAARGMLRDHQEAIAEQRAELERLDAQLATAAKRQQLDEAWQQFRTLQGDRQKAVDAALRALRKHAGKIDDLDNEMSGLDLRMHALADELGEPRPNVRVQRRVLGDAPAPLLEALDQALTVERQSRKSRRRAEAQQEGAPA